MLINPYSYSIFIDFIESYLPSGFLNIKVDDPIIQKLDEAMEENDQFFSVFDMRQMKYLFCSKRSVNMIGIEPDELNLNHWLELVHPECSERLGMVRSQLARIEMDLFMASKGSSLLSYNLKIRKPTAGYTNILFQDYFFYTPIPRRCVLIIQIYSNVNELNLKKSNVHYYCGTDLSFFKFPDEKLIEMGNLFSIREFEIIKLISQCFNNEEIAEKLFLSLHTVNTHRRNILNKSGKTHISELIYELKGKGLI